MRLPIFDKVNKTDKPRTKSAERLGLDKGKLIAGDLKATKKWLENHKMEQFARGDASNNMCFECGANAPQWISANNGIYICLNCAGVHRGFGVQISFVRSLEMDNITELQKKMLLYGGNKQFSEFLSFY